MKQKVLDKLRQKTSGDGSSNLYIDLEKLIQDTHNNFLQEHKEIYDDITVDTTFAELVAALLVLYGDKEYELKIGNDGVVIELGEYLNVVVRKSKAGFKVKFTRQS